MSSYHKPKLNRFDLDVSDMLGSEVVKQMDDRQFGQYMFLLLESWNIGKDCTLPSDSAALSRLARVSTTGHTQVEANVDPIVLKKFRKTDDGRLVNDRMLLEWKNAKKRMKVHQEKSSKGGKASVASKLKSKHSSSTGQPTVQPKLKQSEATIPSSTPTSVAVSDASDLIDLKERTKEGSSFDHSTLEQDKSTTTPVQVELTPQEPADPPCEQCKHGIRQGSGPCYQHSTPAESNSENIGSPAASPEAIQLCQYAIAELNATGIPTKSPCLDFWLTEADALLTYSGNESLADLKGMFAFARRDKHFMQYTFGVPDLKRHVMSDSDKGLKQRFYNARYASQKRDAKTEANHPPKKSKFEGKEI